MFAEKCPIQATSATVELFPKFMYKVQVQTEIYSIQSRPHVCLLDDVTGFTIASKTFWDELPTRTKCKSVPNFRSAIKEPIKLFSTIFLFVRIGDLHFKVWYGIWEHLAVSMLLGMLFLYWCILRIFLGERKKADFGIMNRYPSTQHSWSRVNDPRPTSNHLALTAPHARTLYWLQSMSATSSTPTIESARSRLFQVTS